MSLNLPPESVPGPGFTVPTLCKACAREQRTLNAEQGVRMCSSFPNGIPEDIATWGFDHRESLEGEPPFELDPAKQDLFELWLHSPGPRRGRAQL